MAKFILLIFVWTFIFGVVNAKNCVCIHDDCGCCAWAKIPQLHIDDDLCLNISYIPSTISLSLTFSINDHVYFNETVSAKDPDICIPVPVIDDLLDVCVDFSNMNINGNQVSGCVALAFKVVLITVAKIDLGCFKFDVPEGTENQPSILLNKQIMDKIKLQN